MSDFTWGVDGYGRAHICKQNNIILFCMIVGTGAEGVYILEDQENEKES